MTGTPLIERTGNTVSPFTGHLGPVAQCRGRPYRSLAIANKIAICRETFLAPLRDGSAGDVALRVIAGTAQALAI